MEGTRELTSANPPFSQMEKSPSTLNFPKVIRTERSGCHPSWLHQYLFASQALDLRWGKRHAFSTQSTSPRWSCKCNNILTTSTPQLTQTLDFYAVLNSSTLCVLEIGASCSCLDLEGSVSTYSVRSRNWGWCQRACSDCFWWVRGDPAGRMRGKRPDEEGVRTGAQTQGNSVRG